jgi:hypothetical protein
MIAFNRMSRRNRSGSNKVKTLVAKDLGWYFEHLEKRSLSEKHHVGAYLWHRTIDVEILVREPL